MDEFTIQQELEALAGNAYDPAQDGSTAEPISKTINRWHTLFGISKDDAIDRIMQHRNDFTRSRVSDTHWETVKAEKEIQGYDREAYEYELEVQKKKATLPEALPTSEGSRVTYLIELDGVLASPEKVRLAAEMQVTPEVVAGHSVEEHRPVRLCCVDGQAKTAILGWVAMQESGYEPTILVDPRSLR